MSASMCKPIIKLMITIVDRGQGEKIAEICKGEHIHFHFICLGRGTASSEILDYFGLGETDKDVLISLVPDYKVSALITTISEKMHLKKPGKGIAFTLPISGISSLISQALVHEEYNNIESEVVKMEANVQYSLILVVVNQGYTGQVMAAARSAGATGGTVVHSRGMGHEDAEKFLGISIQSEKEIVLIACNREDKQNIMLAIKEEAGLRTPSRGIILSLPVDSMMGIG